MPMIKKVGAIGCRQMGSGITRVGAPSRYRVVVSEFNDESLDGSAVIVQDSPGFIINRPGRKTGKGFYEYS